MADDWQVGDLALCVNATKLDGFGPFGSFLQRGAIYCIIEICVAGTWDDGSHSVGLRIDGPANANRDGDWHPQRFRRIPPLSDEERASFLADLREPVRQPA